MKKILLACYGGGHVKSLIPVAKLLNNDYGINLNCLGFTTAKNEILNAGLKCMGCSDIYKLEDKSTENLLLSIINPYQNENINPKDALAYNLMGFKELVSKHGKKKGIELLKNHGRKAYLPIREFMKFLKIFNPDFVITSTSPRFELALQIAANYMKINSLAVGDLFLDKEYKYICNKNYSKNLSVFSMSTKKFLKDCGYRGSIFVKGNPAFDNLYEKANFKKALYFRKELKLKESDTLILWICPPSNVDNNCIDSSLVLESLIKYTKNRKNTKFLIRQHPNSQVLNPNIIYPNGIFCDKNIPIEICLYAANKVLVFNSTVLIQASLLEIPTLVYSKSNCPVYDPEFGLNVSSISSLDYLEKSLDELQKPDIHKLGFPSNYNSSKNIYELIKKLITNEK